jgi:hypothetical protein
MHYLLMGKMRLPFIDSDLLSKGALSDRFYCISEYLISKQLYTIVYIWKGIMIPL